MLFCELQVRPATKRFLRRWGWDRCHSRSKFRAQDLVADNAALLGAFKRTEDKSAILADRASERHAKLPALEEWIRIERVATQGRIGGEMVVAKEVEAATMQFVGAGASR